VKISLILATIDRTTELSRFLEQLDRQSYPDIELIIVDQNRDDRLVDILEPYQAVLDIRHIKTDKPGVSRARNIGIRSLNGEIVAFPDDDCWYTEELLDKVINIFRKQTDWDGISGSLCDDEGGLGPGNFAFTPGYINKFNVWRRANTNTIFLRRGVIEGAGGFDELLGPGAGTRWTASEDIDYVLRILEKKHCLYYCPDLKIGHLDPARNYDSAAVNRGFSYGCAMGRMMDLHNYPVWFVAYYLLRPLGGSLLALATGRIGKTRYYWSVFRGRLYGWITSKRLKGSSCEN